MTDRTLQLLGRLVGTWITEATHPAMPGIVARGVSIFEWLEGERFVIHRSRTDHADFPDSISILGSIETDRVDTTRSGDPAAAPEHKLSMHYFDSRGVFRVYDADIDEHTWRISRHAPGFSQRFTGTFSSDGATIEGHWQLNQDDVTWNDDLEITFRRQR